MTEHSFRNQVLRGCSGCSTLLQQQEAHLNGQREKPCDHLTAVGEGGGQKEGEQRVALEFAVAPAAGLGQPHHHSAQGPTSCGLKRLTSLSLHLLWA